MIPTRTIMLADRLRELIISGAVPAGQPLRQDAVAAELGVSKIPLREAMARLEEEGLVRLRANRGFFVTPLDPAEASEVFALREQLEPETAALASLRADRAEREAARFALRRLNRAVALRPETVGRANRDFHLAMIRPARRPVTFSILERLHVIADRYVRKHLEPLGRGERAAAEHRELLGAWLERDSDRVAALAHAHLSGTMRDLERQLAATDGTWKGGDT